MKLLWPYIRQMRAHIGWVALGSLLGLVTLLSSIGLLTLSGWFITATSLAGVAVSFNFFTPGAGVRGFAILRTLGRYGERLATHEATFRLIARLRTWFYQHMEPQRPARLNAIGSAELLSRLIADIGALDNLYLRILSPSLIALCVVALVCGFISLFSGSLALIALCGYLTAGLLVPMLGHWLGGERGAEQARSQARLRTRLVTLIQGMADLRIYGGMARAQAQIDQAQHAYLETQAQMGRTSALVNSLMLLIAGGTLIAVLIEGVSLVQTQQLQAIELVFLLFCVVAAFEAVMPLPLAYQYLGKTRESAARLASVAEKEVEHQFPQQGPEPSRPGAIRFEAVEFGYGGQGRALDKVGFNVEPGEKVLVLGHSGSGKSSLINLLVRFWDPNAGSIELGGQPIGAYTEEALRSQVSVMGQPVQLFAGSIRENLKIGRDTASDQEMLELLDRLKLTAALDGQGLDYQVGEAGSRLSGGQRKRLALGRALLREAPILLLDEPAEGLDPQTEQAVLELILQYRTGQTVLLISHHAAALACFDSAMLMDRGRVLERGDIKQLLEDPGSRISQLKSL
ncbi:cysteine/glutathione ABC transporter ATP-binding protein/permease CydC [Marinobacterium zhoushanense]|uniref:Cysteine/glutathione ABC transporter ATP-binding protein/permease CydC n=1 Tax=Marinobacterium zhoushanense TaxID=1679163 RepID=A0ABQ1KKN5_9GAMM|nr:thiol reductant ABC exporter subunit CydC [Marinobacterium zhoushanense]GGC02804.1 cysteine/glutathione ABC transporter ATP-binding protein/permease CydC [Marinobacterium zhoushanense]